MIPVQDADGAIHSLQFIDANGNKRFLRGGRTVGCSFSIGIPRDVLCIAEGFATGATIRQVTGHPVAIAFNAGNLKPVAMALRNKYPAIQLIICGDDDRDTVGNPGRTHAHAAAHASRGLVALPSFVEVAV